MVESNQIEKFLAKKDKTRERNIEKKSNEFPEKGKVAENIKSNGTFCEICRKKFRSRYYLQFHMAVHTGEKNYICGICEKGYQQKWNLITHVARVHSKEKPFKCNDCDKAFGYSSHFKRHVKTHFLEKIEAPENVKKKILNPHNCDFCEKSFESNYRLELHKRVHTGNRPFVCDKCGKSFTTRRLCTVHMTKTHNEESGFICEHCGKIFPSRSSITLHIKTGTIFSFYIETKPNKTNSCESNSSSFLAEHKLSDISNVQTSETEFHVTKVFSEISKEKILKKEVTPCEVCGKIITRGSVKKHLNIHYRNRVYSCRYCSKDFLESGQRMVHERRHTGEKPYLCDMCGRGHTQYSNLLTHRKRHHNLTTKTPKLWKQNSTRLAIYNVEQLKITNEKLQHLNDFQSPIMPVKKHVKRGYKKENLFIKQSNLDGIQLNLEVEKIGASETKVKPTCTGDETLEEFLKIASQWINKKFEESKHFNLNTDVEKFTEGSSAPLQEYGDTMKNTTKKGIQSNKTITSKVNEADNSQLSKKENAVQVKKIKDKINKIIFEKIVENLRQSKDARERVLEVVKMISSKSEQCNGDVLKEFLKLMKYVPDNSVMQTEDGKVFWHCWICVSRLKSRHLLARHLLIHEPEENRPYRCEICSKAFTQSNNFKEHVMSHHQKNQFYCEKCGNGFRHKSHFNVHMRKHNSSLICSMPKKHECIYCGKKLNSNYQRIEHERTHTKEKPFLCKVCGQQFGALSTLNRHHSTHTVASHQCSVCLKLFRQKSSLKRHIKTHSEYSYNRISCECGRTFSQNSSLKKHKMICKNRMQPVVKPFNCQECLKRFLTKSDLKRHISTHDASKNYKCSICFAHLKTNETFKRHMSRHEECRNEVGGTYQCEACGCSFIDFEAIHKHIVKNHMKSK